VKLKLLLALLALGFAAPAVAQNPCETPITEVKVDPTKIYVSLERGLTDPDFSGLTHFVYEGSGTSPVDTVTSTPAQLSLVPGTTTCYQRDHVPTGAQYKRDDTTQYFVATRVDGLRGTTSPTGERGNPFVLSRPVVPFPAPPTRVGDDLN
jgi:hypothetical protein